MKQNVYISSLFLIILFSLVLLKDFSAECSGNESNIQYLGVQKLSTDKWILEDVTGCDIWDNADPAPIISLYAGTTGQKDVNCSDLFPDKFLSNPFLIDLPPPAHII